MMTENMDQVNKIDRLRHRFDEIREIEDFFYEIRKTEDYLLEHMNLNIFEISNEYQKALLQTSFALSRVMFN